MKDFFQTLYNQIDFRLAALFSGGGGVFGLITMHELLSLIVIFLSLIAGAFAVVKGYFEMRKAIRESEKP